MRNSKKFIFLEHTGEIKFKAFGKSFSEALKNSVLAISSFLSNDQKIKPKIVKKIFVKRDDIKSLLYNFLDELIYLFDAELFIPKNAKISLNENSLKSEIYGDDARKYNGLSHIKSVTYSEMDIKIGKGNCVVQVVLDV